MEIETDADVAERIERSFYVNWPLSVFETATHFYYEKKRFKLSCFAKYINFNCFYSMVS